MSAATSRRRRATAARILLALDAGGQLSTHRPWSWDELDALPDWVLLDRDMRTSLQQVCGCLLLAPILRLWVDGARLKSASMAVGVARFDQVIRHCSAPTILPASPVQQSLDAWLVSVCNGNVERCLSGAGATVLLSTLEDVDMRARLAEHWAEASFGTIPSISGSIPLPAARCIVAQAAGVLSS